MCWIPADDRFSSNKAALSPNPDHRCYLNLTNSRNGGLLTERLCYVESNKTPWRTGTFGLALSKSLYCGSFDPVPM